MSRKTTQTVSGAAAILVNPDHQVLLQQRDEKPGLPLAGWWTLFGGRAEPGETPDENIRRELTEELEIPPEVRWWKMYQHGPYDRDGLQIVVNQHIYVGRVDLPENEIVFHEGQAVKFVSRDELNTMRIAFGFDELLRGFFEQGVTP
jgi:8-oxo-dGTP diphosphatase